MAISAAVAGLISAGVSAAGAIGSSLINGANTTVGNAKQYKYTKMLQEDQNDFNVDFWNKQNEYNSAASQVDRIREAGLNVGMMMSGQGAGQAQQLTASNSQFNAMQAPPVQNPFQGVGSDIMNGMNIDLVKRQQDINKDIAKRDLDIKEKEVDSKIKVNESVVSLNKIEGKVKKKTLKKLDSEIKVLEQTAKNLVENNKLIQEYIATEKVKQKSLAQQGEAAVINAYTNQYNAVTNRISANATADYMKQQGEESKSRVVLNEKEGEKICQDIVESMSRTKLNNVEFEWKGKNYKIEYELKEGQMRILNIEGDIADKTKHAKVATAWIGTVNEAAMCVSNAMGAYADVSTGGLTKKLGDAFQGSNAPRTSYTNPNLYSNPAKQ